MASDKTLAATIKLRDEMTKVLEDINKNLGDFQEDINLASNHLGNMQDSMNTVGNSANSFNNDINSSEDSIKSFSNAINGLALKELGSSMAEAGKQVLSAVWDVVETTKEWEAEVAQQEFIYNNLDSSIQKVIDSSSEEARALGMTSQQYANISTNLDSYYKNMGLTTDQITSMSTETMNLVSDMAAFADVDTTQAAQEFKSALMGNFEAVDKYGVSLSAATLENSEYVKSLGKSWNQLTDNEKMLAAYNEILRQSSDYTGLGAQEASEFGAQWKLLKQDVKEATSALGSQLLPILAPIVQWIGNATRAVGDWAAEHPKLAQFIMVSVAAIGAILVVGGGLLTFLGMCAIAMTAVSTAGGIMAVVMGALTSPITLVIAAIGLLISAGLALGANWDWVCNKATELKEWVVDKFIEIKENAIREWEAFKDNTIQFFNDTVDQVKEIWDNLTTFLSNPIQGTINIIKNYADRHSKDGSNAFGLNRVPYDGFVSELHAGEKVLTANEAREYDKGKSSNGITINFYGTQISKDVDVDDMLYKITRKLKVAQLSQG